MLNHLESSGFSTFLRESDSLLAFPGVLIAHTLGMALVAGIAMAVSLRLLGIGAAIPLRSLHSFIPYAWLGLALNAASGLLLVIAYPTKALTNPVFYAKLVLIGLAVLALLRVDRRWLRGSPRADAEASSPRLLATCTLVLWMLTITAGRLLPYTYRHLFAWEP